MHVVALLTTLSAYTVVSDADVEARRAAFFAREPTALAVSFDRFGFVAHAELRRYVIDDRFTADEIATALALIVREASAFGVDDVGAFKLAPGNGGLVLTATQPVAGVTVGAMLVSKRADSIAVDGHFWPGAEGARIIGEERAARVVAGARVEITGLKRGPGCDPPAGAKGPCERDDATVTVQRDVRREDITLTLVPYLRLQSDGVTAVRFAWRIDVATARLLGDSGLECDMFSPCSIESLAPQAIDAVSGRLMDRDLAVCMPRTPPRPGAPVLAWCR